MSRRRNLWHWAGFLIVLAAPVLYVAIFVTFPSTRDAPWPTLSMFGAGLFLIAVGLIRAYREPQVYRGRIAAPIVAALGVALTGYFCVSLFYVARQIPPGTGAPRVGESAPDFTLPDTEGRDVSLFELLQPDAGSKETVNGVVLVFYRGHW